MKTHHIPFKDTSYFSNLITDYLDKNNQVTPFYGNFPDLNGFKNQIELKKSFSFDKRKTLVETLKNQYNSTKISELTSHNINLLESDNTFTITKIGRASCRERV